MRDEFIRSFADQFNVPLPQAKQFAAAVAGRCALVANRYEPEGMFTMDQMSAVETLGAQIARQSLKRSRLARMLVDLVRLYRRGKRLGREEVRQAKPDRGELYINSIDRYGKRIIIAGFVLEARLSTPSLGFTTRSRPSCEARTFCLRTKKRSQSEASTFGTTHKLGGASL